jgi:hypothetical protein
MCYLCRHEKRAAIDLALQENVRPAQVRRLFQLTVAISVICRHRDVCLLGKPNPSLISAARKRAAEAEAKAMRSPAMMKAIGCDVEPNYLDDEAARRVICAGLLQAVKDAQRGDTEARSWIESEHARAVAGWIDLDDHWPPTLAQIAGSKVTRSGMGSVTQCR